MRAQKLAQLVVAGATWHAWFDDEVTLAPEHAPPLTEEEAGRLRDARRRLGADLVYANSRIPAVDDSSDRRRDGQLCTSCCRKSREIEDAVANGQVLPLAATTPSVLEAARALCAQVQDAIALAECSKARTGIGLVSLRVKCRLPSFASERAALEALFDDLDTLIEARAAFLKRPVDFPEAGLYSAQDARGDCPRRGVGKAVCRHCHRCRRSEGAHQSSSAYRACRQRMRMIGRTCGALSSCTRRCFRS